MRSAPPTPSMLGPHLWKNRIGTRTAAPQTSPGGRSDQDFEAKSAVVTRASPEAPNDETEGT
eukprot:3329329-Pyramimonas_sp.AAC.1